MIQPKSTDLTMVEYPWLASWDLIVRKAVAENADCESHSLTQVLRLLMYEAFVALRGSIEDPGCPEVSWKSPLLTLIYRYPRADKHDDDQTEPHAIRPLLDMLLAGRAAVSRNGGLSPLLPTELLRAFSSFPEEERQKWFSRWVDLSQWTRPMSYGDDEDAGRKGASILGRSQAGNFSASLIFKIFPRIVDFDLDLIQDTLQVGIPWSSYVSPDNWTTEEQDALWATVTEFLYSFRPQTGGRLPSIWKEVKDAAHFDSFEGRFIDGQDAPFSKKNCFRPEKAVFGRFPAYARGNDGPYLKITDGNGNLRADVIAAIQGAMCYPDDEGRRHRLISAYRVKLFLKICRKIVEHFSQSDCSAHEIEGLVFANHAQDLGVTMESISAAADSPPLESLVRDLDAMASAGCVAGEVLMLILNCAERHPEHVSVGKAVHLVARDSVNGKDRRGRPVNYGMSTIRAAWGKYRDVAHLWGALLHWVQDKDLDPEWGLTVEGVENFLAVAESLRKKGEVCFARAQKKRHGPILDPSRTWRTTPDLVLPEIKLTWPPLTDWTRECLAEYHVSS